MQDIEIDAALKATEWLEAKKIRTMLEGSSAVFYRHVLRQLSRSGCRTATKDELALAIGLLVIDDVTEVVEEEEGKLSD